MIAPRGACACLRVHNHGWTLLVLSSTLQTLRDTKQQPIQAALNQVAMSLISDVESSSECDTLECTAGLMSMHIQWLHLTGL